MIDFYHTETFPSMLIRIDKSLYLFTVRRKKKGVVVKVFEEREKERKRHKKNHLYVFCNFLFFSYSLVLIYFVFLDEREKIQNKALFCIFARRPSTNRFHFPIRLCSSQWIPTIIIIYLQHTLLISMSTPSIQEIFRKK